MYWIRREQKWLGVAGDAQHGTQEEQQKEQQKTSRSLISTMGLACKNDHVIVNGRRRKLEVCRLSTDLP